MINKHDNDSIYIHILIDTQKAITFWKQYN